MGALRRGELHGFAGALFAVAALLVVPAFATPPLSADQIVEKSIAARGGLQTWTKIDSLAWIGHIESERLGGQELKFSLEEKRPNKTRFDLIGAQPSARVFNGMKGWKTHSRNDGPPEVESYSQFEERFAREAPGFGGPLIAYREQRRQFTLLGIDPIEGRDCYRLGVVLPAGGQQTIWVDAQTFLEARFDRPTYTREGKVGTVSVYFRNYQTQGGLQLPTVFEIGAGGTGKPDRLVIERVAINPDISESRFLRPPAPPHSREVTLPPSGSTFGAPAVPPPK